MPGTLGCVLQSGATVRLEGMSLKNLARADASATRTAPGGATALAFVFPLWLFNFDRLVPRPPALPQENVPGHRCPSHLTCALSAYQDVHKGVEM